MYIDFLTTYDIASADLWQLDDDTILLYDLEDVMDDVDGNETSVDFFSAALLNCPWARKPLKSSKSMQVSSMEIILTLAHSFQLRS